MNNLTNTITIDDQIRNVDKFLKDCENSRKNLESISARLDDLNDEVKRYRDFLMYEKTRRDPALYKTSNSIQPSGYNDSICYAINELTHQFTQEWIEKLKNIQVATQSKYSTATRTRIER